MTREGAKPLLWAGLRDLNRGSSFTNNYENDEGIITEAVDFTIPHPVAMMGVGVSVNRAAEADEGETL